MSMLWLTIAFLGVFFFGVFCGFLLFAFCAIGSSDPDDYEFGKLVDRSLDDKEMKERVIGKAQIGKD